MSQVNATPLAISGQRQRNYYGPRRDRHLHKPPEGMILTVRRFSKGLLMSMFQVTKHPKPTAADARAGLMADPGFGKIFSDHMVTMRWKAGQGWVEGQVRAREAFAVDPATAVLHYAQEIFEGMKAYRVGGGRIVLFRPRENAKRFARSAARMAMPELPEDTFLDAVNALVRTDRGWVPDSPGSLYLRPFMFADEAFLGVRPASSYIFCVIASPVGPYFKGGEKPISVWVSEEFSRAGPGGTGEAKCGGNYAASLVAQAEAIRQGCDQVVFLDAAEFRWVEELGGMNIFYVFDNGDIVTPPLGTILPGITRASIITLARDLGLNVREEKYGFPEWIADAEAGRLREVFACGTAATIAAIGHVKHAGGAFDIAGGGTGEVTRKLRSALLDLQRGAAPDPYGWVQPVE